MHAVLEHVELSYKNAAVLIKYSPLDYIFPKGYKYAYRMEGLDQNWNYIERNEVIYSHLPAGEYTFYIKACNSDGIWGMRQVSMSWFILLSGSPDGLK